MDMNERLAKLEADEKNIFHQLSEIKDEVKDIRRLTLAVEKIAVKTESIDLKVDNMGSRISTLEKEPGETHLYYKRTVFTSALTACIGAVVGALLALIMRI